jgi:NTE family protein
MTRGLVLGCGGPVGLAWEVATLRELERAWDWDARSAEVIVGTSCGAELACLIGGGIAVEEVFSALIAATAGEGGGEGRGRPWLRRHLDLDPGRWPPRPGGRHVTGSLHELAANVATEAGWVGHPNTWLVAADLGTRRRVAFGSPGAPPATLADALCASWGLPLWVPPTEIAGHRYIDGGLLSPASADLVAPLGLDEVVVLTPMASADPGRPVGLLARGERLVRHRMTRILESELAAVTARGTRVRRFEPGGRELAVMGGNFMDVRRQRATLVSATATARERLAASAG